MAGKIFLLIVACISVFVNVTGFLPGLDMVHKLGAPLPGLPVPTELSGICQNVKGYCSTAPKLPTHGLGQLSAIPVPVDATQHLDNIDTHCLETFHKICHPDLDGLPLPPTKDLHSGLIPTV